jgi:hypothetical protein
MTTEKQREANRRNAALSTGPKTREGKDKVRLNPLKHGLRAEIVELLPHEDRVEFTRRLDAYNHEYAPQSEIEVHLVRQAVVLTWKIERADRHEIASLSPGVIKALQPVLDDPDRDPDLVNQTFSEAADLASFDSSAEGERIRRYQFALQSALFRTLDRLGKPRNLMQCMDDDAVDDPACSTRVSETAETADRSSPAPDSSTEAVSVSPIESQTTIPAACTGGAAGRGADAPRSPKPIAPNKAILAGGKRRKELSREQKLARLANSVGRSDPRLTRWDEISIEKR